jgi:hypothetical protein
MTSRVSFERWESEFGPILESLMAALYVSRGSIKQSPAALLSSSDQLFASARSASVWASVRRCPVADLDARLERLIRSYRVLGELMALEAVSPTGPDRRALTRELDGLIGVLSQMLAAMSDLAKVETE